jgi:hypothetical protein
MQIIILHNFIKEKIVFIQFQGTKKLYNIYMRIYVWAYIYIEKEQFNPQSPSSLEACFGWLFLEIRHRLLTSKYYHNPSES